MRLNKGKHCCIWLAWKVAHVYLNVYIYDLLLCCFFIHSYCLSFPLFLLPLILLYLYFWSFSLPQSMELISPPLEGCVPGNNVPNANHTYFHSIFQILQLFHFVSFLVYRSFGFRGCVSIPYVAD